METARVFVSAEQPRTPCHASNFIARQHNFLIALKFPDLSHAEWPHPRAACK
jgi:hypothetical protein